jgi:hypothetical protein
LPTDFCTLFSYYDLTETSTYDQCGGSVGSGKPDPLMWAWDSGINNSTTLCETKMTNPPSLASIGTNRIVGEWGASAAHQPVELALTTS